MPGLCCFCMWATRLAFSSCEEGPMIGDQRAFLLDDAGHCTWRPIGRAPYAGAYRLAIPGPFRTLLSVGEGRRLDAEDLQVAIPGTAVVFDSRGGRTRSPQYCKSAPEEALTSGVAKLTHHLAFLSLVNALNMTPMSLANKGRLGRAAMQMAQAADCPRPALPLRCAGRSVLAGRQLRQHLATPAGAQHQRYDQCRRGDQQQHHRHRRGDERGDVALADR